MTEFTISEGKDAFMDLGKKENFKTSLLIIGIL